MIKEATAIYTGGGIYVYLGELDDGNYFLASDWSSGCVGDIRILNEDPRKVDDDECFYPEWQETYLVKDMDDTTEEARRMWNEILFYIIQNNPEGNYSISELKDRIIEKKEE